MAYFKVTTVAIPNTTAKLVYSTDFDTSEVTLKVVGAASAFGSSSTEAATGWPLADGGETLTTFTMLPHQELWVKAAAAATAYVRTS